MSEAELDASWEVKLEKCREERLRLQSELEQLQRQSVPPPVKRSQKLTDLETQITDYRERIRQQEIELTKPLPKFDESLPQQLDITKRHYAELANERMTLVKHPQLDALDGRFLKEFDKLEYVRKAYFPLFNEKQSTLLGFSQAEDCGLRYQLQDQLEESHKLQTANETLRISIETLAIQLDHLQRQLAEP